MKYFTLEELSRSTTAIKLGISNVPDAKSKLNLTKLIDNLLDPIREAYGLPIIVTSGYRSNKLNALVGGSSTSQHKYGLAADIRTVKDTLVDNRKLYDLIRTLNLEYDQLIYEFGSDIGPDWIHISYSDRPRRLNLRAIKKAGKTLYIEDK